MILQSLGSDQYQCFLHSKPLTAKDFGRLLEQGGDPAAQPALS